VYVDVGAGVEMELWDENCDENDVSRDFCSKK
jgi:hypothetical protein